MDAQNNKTQKKDVETVEKHSKDVSSYSPEIKKLRTFAEDLKDAKKRAGIVDTQKEKKKGFFFNKKTIKPTEKHVEEKKEIITPVKKLESIKIPKKVDTLDKKRIELELSKSGLVPETKKTENLSSQTKKELSSISKIHTYKTDAVELIKDNDLSVVSIAAAAEKKRTIKNIEKPEEKTPVLKNIILGVVSIVLVAGGIGGVWYFYTKSDELNSIKQNTTISSLIFSDTQKDIDISGLSGEILIDELYQNFLQENGNKNTVVYFYLTENKLGQSVEIKIDDLLSRISDNIPNRLIRSLRPEFMFGAFISEKNIPFIILKTNSFENSFASMLDWEKTIFSDLAPLFGSDSNENIINGTFNDVIVKNKDTRILRGESGEISIMYSFTDENTIIITTNKDVFFEIFRRISTSNNK